MTIYRHTQIGWTLLAFAFGVLPILMIALDGSRSVPLPFVLAAIIALLFGTLTVIVDDKRISWRFGIGLIRKSLPVKAVASFRAVRNPWYYGWGIRLTPLGWLYNVSGFSAVALALNDGRHVLIGTDEPDALQQSLWQVVIPAEPRDPVLGKPPSRRASILVILGINAVIVPAILWSVHAGLQPPAVTISPTMFSVHDGFYGADVPIAGIQEISLQDGIPRVMRRTNGLAAGNVLRGNFNLEVLGPGKLFINLGVPPYLVVKSPGSLVIVNFADPQRTRAVYEDLRRYVAAR
jgi:hypothetical protein